MRRAFVEAHRDIAVEQTLNLDGSLGRQMMFAAVPVRTECDAVFGHLAQRRQRHDLIATGIRHDRPGPVHEGVQPANLCHAFRAPGLSMR